MPKLFYASDAVKEGCFTRPAVKLALDSLVEEGVLGSIRPARPKKDGRGAPTTLYFRIEHKDDKEVK